MLSTILWALWGALFVVLEWLGIRRRDDKTYSLTNRIRALMRAHPVLRWVISVGIVGLLAWLFQHFILVDPEVHPGALW